MLSFRIALRYLFAKKSHSAVNIISLVSMAGVAVAAMAMICVMSVFNGFTDVAARRLSLMDPQLKVTPANGDIIANADSIATAVSRIEGVGLALPVLCGQALAMFGQNQLPVIVQGIPDGYDNITDISSTVIDGELRSSDEKANYATLSVGLALSLNARPGYLSALRLMVPRRNGRINPALPISAFRSDTLIVSGVYQSEQQEYDTDRILIPLADARRIFEYTTEATSVDIALTPGADVHKTAEAISRALGTGFRVADRMEQQEASFRMIRIEKWVTFLMLTFILIMASFNILSTMSMLIIEKRRNTAILAAIGTPASTLRRIFLNQGFMIAAVGGAAGLMTGTILTLLQKHFELIKLGGDHSIMSISAYPVRLSLTDILAVAAIVAVTGIISGAISAARVDTSPQINR